MAERKQVEFFLLRYVPDAVKGEFVNFGLVALESGPNGDRLIDVRFVKDWGRLLCLDPQADTEMLTALQKEIREEIGQARDRAVLLKRMEDSFSGVIQISGAMPMLAEFPALEIETVAGMYLETPKLRRVREPAGRQRILATMRDEFEKAGVLGMMNPVPVEPYSTPGDPFEFDLGYNTGKEIKLFHAVSMKASVDSAVLLAARWPRIMPAMARVTGAASYLTAVVEDGLDRSEATVVFALRMMEEEKIRVARVAEMAGIAEGARLELGG